MSHICDRFSVFNFFSFLLCVLPRLNELFFFAGRSEKREARSEKREARKREEKKKEKETKRKLEKQTRVKKISFWL
jgi:hypothetical protein